MKKILILPCTHSEFTWRSIGPAFLLVLSCWSSRQVCFAADEDSNHFASELRAIQIVPDRIVVTADYPATFSVIACFSDGTQCDVRLEGTTRFEIEDPNVIAWGNDSFLVAKAEGKSTLHAEWYGQKASASVFAEKATTESPTFAREVAAVLSKHGCNLGTCHGNLHGKGGFRLSLRGDEPWWDAKSIVLDRGGRRIDLFSPERSLILRKASGSIAHQGGLRFDKNSAAFDWISRWIKEGAEISSAELTESNSIAHEDELELRVFPERSVVPAHLRRQQVTVIARWPNGTQRDITRWARLEPNVTTGVSIHDSGRIEVTAPMDLSIGVSYLGARTSSRIIFRQSDDQEQETKFEGLPSRIDELIANQLSAARVQQTPIADPLRVLRRLFLVALGRLPTSNEIREFHRDLDEERWERWVDRVLADPANARMWALRWSDILRNEQKVMSPQGTKNLHKWLTDCFASDTPLTEMSSALIESTGSTYENPPASFHRTHRDPMIAAESVGQVFLGVRLQCARCHNHPFDVWKQDDYYGLSAFFTTIEREQIDNKRPDDLDKHVITGDEIIRLAERPASIQHPGRSMIVGPRTPLAREKILPPLEQGKPLEAIADWLTHDNRQFARNMANRIWFHLIGKGIVDPPDDFRVSNPPSNPELLEYLTDELIQSNYSTRHLSRLILNSLCFHREPVSQVTEVGQLPSAALFAGYPIRRMQAEVLFDALCDATGTIGPVEDLKKMDEPFRRAVEATTIPPSTTFVRAFGKPERLLVCECERSDQMSVLQPLLMLNSEEVRRRVGGRNNRVRRLLKELETSDRILDELFLASVSRFPNENECKRLIDYVDQSGDRQQAFEDILHALINCQEFVFVH